MLVARTKLAALILFAFASTSVAASPDDWANLARYRDANGALAPTDSRRVVFMGDSITEGWGKGAFIHANPHFVDRGISGQTAPQMLVRFRSDVLQLKPAVVHIMAGTNDIAGNTGPETENEAFGYIVSMRARLIETPSVKDKGRGQDRRISLIRRKSQGRSGVSPASRRARASLPQ